MKKYLIPLVCCYIFSILQIPCFGFIDPPPAVRYGSDVFEAYKNRGIEIIEESIKIKIEEPHYAKHEITYTVRSNKQGIQIPFIFAIRHSFSQDSILNFRAWIDNIETPKSEKTYKNNDIEFKQWANSMGMESLIDFESDKYTSISNWIYFDVNLRDSLHSITIKYTTWATIDTRNPVKHFSFDYNLKPAYNWNLLKNLKIEIDASNLPNPIETNIIGTPSSPDKNILQWNFSKIPQNEFTIKYIPQFSTLADILSKIGAFNLANITVLLLIAFHIYLINLYRRKHPSKRFSPIVIIGGIIIPLICLSLYIIYHMLIDNLIGEYASGNFLGNIFILIIATFFVYLYIFTMPVYMFIVWSIDKHNKS